MKKQLLWQIHFTIFLIVFFNSGCSDSNDKEKDGIKVVHFKGTEIIRQTIEYKNGKKNGFFTEFYRDGKIKAKQYFIDDQKDDTSKLFHENGQIRSLQIYKNKLKEGCWKEYNKKGKLYSEIYFKNDLLDSTSTIYTYNTGKILTQITYKNGLKNGIEKRYYNNGKARSIAYYDMGRACKGTEEWYETGEKVNNDFLINITEHNEVLMKNTLTFNVQLENPQKKDEVYQIVRKGEGRNIGAVFPLKKSNSIFTLTYTIPKNGFVMEEVTIAAYRQTKMGNTFIKTKSFNATSNNF